MGSIANPLYFFSGPSTPTPPSSNVIRFIDILESFFIAYPSSGRKEGEEHKRIMFYHPKGEHIDRQTEVTGFAEAVVNFTDNFLPSTDNKPIKFNESDNFDFRTVTTQKTEQIYIRLEDNQFLMGASLSKQLAHVSNYPLYSDALKNILCDAYKMFLMFFGTFSSFKPEENDEKLKERLDFFYAKYVPLLKVHIMPLLDQLGGVEFLRMPGPLYLNIVSLITELQEEFPQLEKIMFLYQNKLLYYQLSRKDLPSLFRYLTQNLLPTSLAPELEPHGRTSKGRYLRGPSDLTSDAPLIGDEALPILHLHTAKIETNGNNVEHLEDEEFLVKYQMMVYRLLNATVCMFVRHDDSQEKSPTKNGVVSRRLLNNIHLFLETELADVASKIGEEVDNDDGPPDAPDFHYIYFNPSSLSMTSSMSSLPVFPSSSATSAPITKVGIPPMDVRRLVCETMSNFVSSSEEFGECFVKSESDWWIAIKKVNSRLLVIMLPPNAHTSSLADAQSKTTLIVRQHFEDIFFN